MSPGANVVKAEKGYTSGRLTLLDRRRHASAMSFLERQQLVYAYVGERAIRSAYLAL
jgi:hypothetical protein